MTVTKSPITGESAKETVKTIACGNAGWTGVSVVTNSCVTFLHTRLRVQRASGIPHALSGEWFVHDPGGLRRGKAEVCVELFGCLKN
jgi:hypothetical protein